MTGRSVLVKRLRPLPVEAVVRHLAGSGWVNTGSRQSVCGVPPPPGWAWPAAGAIFTPATKADMGATTKIFRSRADRGEIVPAPLANGCARLRLLSCHAGRRLRADAASSSPTPSSSLA